MLSFVIVPAYGRDYKTREDVLKDWNDGKDFKIRETGQYVSIRDAKALKKNHIMYLRFYHDRMTNVFWINL